MKGHQLSSPDLIVNENQRANQEASPQAILEVRQGEADIV